jgi:hypothetical protein
MKQTIALSIALSAFFVFFTPMYGQHGTGKKTVTTTQQRGYSDLQRVQKVLDKQLKGYTNVQSFNNYGREEINLPPGLIERYVLEYYHLHDKYDSPLKRKMFKQSSEYESLLRKMETERNKLLADTFYIVEKVHKTNFNLNTWSFCFDVPQTNIIYSTTHYIDYGYVGIVSPLLKNNGLEVRILDDNDALEIENEYNDCRLVYVFTVNEELSKQTENTGLGCHLICDMQTLYFINLKKSKVYYAAATGYVLKKYVQYDKDVYASYELTNGYVVPRNYYLKSGNNYIEIEMAGLDEYGYDYEESDGHYYVHGTDGKRYLLNFKPEIAFEVEKTEAYFAKCDEIAKDYKLHPENYQDVTIVKEDENWNMHYYIDKTGCAWYHQSEHLGCYVLEEEGVYMIFDELKFIKKKK